VAVQGYNGVSYRGVHGQRWASDAEGNQLQVVLVLLGAYISYQAAEVVHLPGTR
jgi:hypothetical protein